MTGMRIDKGGAAPLTANTESGETTTPAAEAPSGLQRVRDVFSAVSQVSLAEMVGLAVGVQRLALQGIAPSTSDGVRTRSSNFTPPMPMYPPLPPRGPGLALAGGPAASVARAGVIGAGATLAAEGARAALIPALNAIRAQANVVMSVSDAVAGASGPQQPAEGDTSGRRIVRDPEFGDVDIGAMEARMNAEIRSSGHLPENLRNPDALYGHFQRNSDTIRNSVQYFAEKRPERAAKLLENLRADNTVVIPKGYEVRISSDLTASIVPK